MTIVKTNRFKEAIYMLFWPFIKFNKLHLGIKIILGLVLGSILGLYIDAETTGRNIAIVGDLFMRLLKFIVIPVIFLSVTTAVANTQKGMISHIFPKVIGLFLGFTLIAASIGIVLPELLALGEGLKIEADPTKVATIVENSKGVTLKTFLLNIVQPNAFGGFANNNNILFVILTAVLFGISIAKRKETTKAALDHLNAWNEIISEVVNIIMHLAPYGIFAIMAWTVSKQDIGILQQLFFLLITGALGMLFIIYVLPTIVLYLLRLSPRTFFRKIFPAQSFAFSSSSSAATIPESLIVAHDMGISKENSDFTIPLGATINMSGTAFCLCFYTIFISHLYSIELGIGGYATIIGLSSVMAAGIAGVPSASLVTLVVILSIMNIPLEGVAIIIGIDRIMDMFRTKCNVTWDILTSLIVDKWNGKLNIEKFNS
jgi:Na+/H+-dicarboxylate symporter